MQKLKPSRVSTVIAANQHSNKVSTCRTPASKPPGVMPKSGTYQTTSTMSDTRFRLVVMGDSYVGKSSIIRKFLHGTFDTFLISTWHIQNISEVCEVSL